MGYCCDASSVQALASLQHLQHLSFEVGFEECQPLLQLAQLSSLQHVALSYCTAKAAAATAPVWRQLRQLRELSLICEGVDSPNMQQWAGISAAVAACTNLTSLMLDVTIWEDWEANLQNHQLEQIAVCASVAGLPYLKNLHIRKEPAHRTLCPNVVPCDALRLTVLTGLSRLVLEELGDGVGDLAATALACNLRQLQHLGLRRCSLGSMACLAAIAQLTRLTALQLEGNDGLTQQGLLLLTGLTQLQQLGVDRNAEVTDEVFHSFWAAVKGQQ
jgi:hypothetical protein